MGHRFWVPLTIFDPLGPCCRSRGDRIWRRAPIISVLTPPLGRGGRLRRVWGLHVSLGHWGGGGWSPLGSSRPLFNDPRGHLGVTWGVYLCAGKPPLADIILSHPADLTRCDSVIGLAIPAMSGHIQYRGAAS